MFYLNNNFGNTKPVQPILKWAGGKAGLIACLNKFFPIKFENYYEPFLGGGACFFALNKEKHIEATINDINPELINLYQAVRDYPEEIMLILDAWQMEYSEVFFYHLRSLNSSDPIQQAARTIFLNKTCFNGLYRQNKKGEFNVSFGHRLKCPNLYSRANFLLASEHLKTAKLLCGDFEKVLDLAIEGDLVYCDPPYLPVSETSFNYTGDGFNALDHVRLHKAAQRAVDRGADVVISSSDSPLAKEIYEGWQIRKLSVGRAINSNGAGREKIQELVLTKTRKRLQQTRQYSSLKTKTKASSKALNRLKLKERLGIT